MSAKLLRVLAVVSVGLVCWAASAQAAVIVSDDFTGDGSMSGRTPDGTNLPGNNWATNASYWGVPSTSGGEIANTDLGSVSQIDISSVGGYTKPTTLTVSTTMRTESNLRHGVGAMFSYLDPTPNNNSAWGQFLGLNLNDNGNVEYYSTTFTGDFYTRSPSSVQNWNAGADGAFDTNALYTLTYTVDIGTGKITAVSLTGSTQDFSAILNDAAAPFTDANTKYVGISADYSSTTETADIGSILITPEPATLALLGLGGLGLILRRKRR